VCVCVCVCVHSYTPVCVCVCVCVCVYTYIHRAWASPPVCVPCVWQSACMRVCMYTHTHTHTHKHTQTGRKLIKGKRPSASRHMHKKRYLYGVPRFSQSCQKGGKSGICMGVPRFLQSNTYMYIYIRMYTYVCMYIHTHKRWAKIFKQVLYNIYIIYISDQSLSHLSSDFFLKKIFMKHHRFKIHII